MLSFNKAFNFYFYLIVCFSGLTYYSVFNGNFVKYKEVRDVCMILAFALSLFFVIRLRRHKISDTYILFSIFIVYGVAMSLVHGYLESDAEVLRFILYLNIYLIVLNSDVKISYIKICQIISIIGVTMYVVGYGRVLNSTFRVTGNTASVMGYASLVYTSHLIMLILIRKRSDYHKLKLSIIPLLAVVASGSRSILFIQILTVIVAYFDGNNITYRKIIFKIFKVSLLIILLLSIINYMTNLFFRFEILLNGSLGTDTSTAFRIMLFNTVVDNYNEFIFTGIGLGSFPLWFEGKTAMVDVAPHSDLIWLLVEYGILGTPIYLAFLYFAYKNSYQKNILVLVFILLQLIPLHFANSFYFYQVGMLQFAFIGYLHRKKTKHYSLISMHKDEIKILGVKVNKLTIGTLNCMISDIVSSGEKKIIAHHNLHSVYLVNKLPEIKEFWEIAHVTQVDGMALVWWAKALGHDLKRENRITYLDWIYPLMDLANENKWKIYYLGGKPGVATKASKKLNELYPNITFSGHSGYFNMEADSVDNLRVLESINEFNPNILMVGMGMPRQERWILDNYDKISANVVLSTGACFDYIAGEQKTPPRFLGRIGLEWFYRLVNDPKRLSKRYLLEPFSIIPLMVRDILEIKS